MKGLSRFKAPLIRLLKTCTAIFYDGLALFSILACYTLPLVAINHGEAIPTEQHWYPLTLLLFILAYYCCSWRWGGQTIGQRAVGIQIKSLNGNQLSWGQCFRRCLLLLPAIILSPIAHVWFSVNLSEHWTHTRGLFTRKQRYNKSIHTNHTYRKV